MTSRVIVLDRTIYAGLDRVWQVLTGIDRAEEVLRSVHHVEPLTEGPYGVGTTWREQRTFLGHHGREVLKVVQCDPPHHTMVEAQMGHDRVTTSYALTPHEHTTRVSLTMSADLSGRTPFGRVAWNTWGEFGYEKTRKLLRHDLDDIASAAEAAEQAANPSGWSPQDA
ncbi:MAG: SRPBCC family protein [Marmoricola sp.]